MVVGEREGVDECSQPWSAWPRSPARRIDIFIARKCSRWPPALLADELQVVDEDVVVGGRDVDLELDAVDLRRRDVRLARAAPARHLLHRLPREDVLLPLGGQVQVAAEVVEALRADAAFRIGVRVRNLEAHLARRVLAFFAQNEMPAYFDES